MIIPPKRGFWQPNSLDVIIDYVMSCMSHYYLGNIFPCDFFSGSRLVGRGQKYTGAISVTESGQSCLPWYQQQFYPDSMFPELQGARASCRNPGGKGDRPWCYVNFTEDAAVRWEYCDVPKFRKFITTHLLWTNSTYSCIDGCCYHKCTFVLVELCLSTTLKVF